MTGFIIIIVIIAVIIIGSMFFFLRPRHTTSLESTKAVQLLNSMMSYSVSACSGSPPMSDVVRMCNNMEDCSGSSSCDVLNNTVTAILRTSIGELQIGEVRGWSFRAKSNETGSLIREFSEGRTNGSMIGASYIIPMPDIVVDLKIYY
jgi:hypothetical protein